jgi:hypothetical protein
MGSATLRFVLTASGLADRHVGLEWEPCPSAVPVTWGEAVAGAAERGWRLPSAAELMCFLGDAPVDAIWLPPAGTVIWSASGSPFARANQVRAVSRDRDGRFVVLLLDKGARAWRWGVRRPAAPPTPPAG